MNEIATKAYRIDKMVGHLEVMYVRELIVSVETLEDKATTAGGFELGASSMGSVARIKERNERLDNAQQAIVQMVSKMFEDSREVVGVVVRVEVANLSARLNLTIRTVGSQTPTGV